MVSKKLIFILSIFLVVLVVLPLVLIRNKQKINETNHTQNNNTTNIPKPTPSITYSRDLFLKLREVGEIEKEDTTTRNETISTDEGKIINLQVPGEMSTVSAETWKKYMR